MPLILRGHVVASDVVGWGDGDILDAGDRAATFMTYRTGSKAVTLKSHQVAASFNRTPAFLKKE